MSTLLIGSFGDKNAGDELILCSTLDTIPDATVMTANSVHSQQFLQKDFETILPPPTGFRSLIRFVTDRKYRSSVYKIRTKKKVVFAGGGLLCGGLKAYLIWAMTATWVRFLAPNAAISWLGQGVDPTQNIFKKWLIKWALKGANTVQTRDVISQAQLARIGIEAELSNDTAAMWLSKLPPKAIDAEWQNTMLVNAVRPISKSLWRQIIDTHEKIVFVAFSPLDKRNAPDGVRVVCAQNVDKLLTICASAKGMIGERFHAIVVAHSLKRPVWLLREAYAPKVATFAARHKISAFLGAGSLKTKP